jgi:hypothetical protein
MSSTNNLAERDKILDKIQKEIINKKNLLIEMRNKDYINSQLTIYEKQLEKLRSLLEQNDLLALEKKDNASLLKEIKMDQKDIYAEIRKIENELNKIN